MINLKSIVEEALGLPEGSLKVKSQKIMVQVELDTSSTKEAPNSQETGEEPESGQAGLRHEAPDTHSQIKKEIDKDYEKM